MTTSRLANGEAPQPCGTQPRSSWRRGIERETRMETSYATGMRVGYCTVSVPRGLHEIETWLASTMTPGELRPICLVLARPTSDLLKLRILPDLDYLHARSGNDLDLFVVGYADLTSTVPVEELHNHFRLHTFMSALGSLQSVLRWRYGGEAEAIIATARMNRRGKVEVCSRTIITVQLERAIRERAIASIPAFWETLVASSKGARQRGVPVTVPDVLGPRAMLQSLWSGLSSRHQGFRAIAQWRKANLLARDFSNVKLALRGEDATEVRDEVLSLLTSSERSKVAGL